jgi:hypothetical protein
MPARLSAEACTKISLPPRSDAIKPNPFIPLHHLTVGEETTEIFIEMVFETLPGEDFGKDRTPRLPTHPYAFNAPPAHSSS